MAERRVNQRMPVMLAGEVQINSRVALPCRVRDVSRGGALIAFAKADKLPERFGLRIGTAAAAREVLVAWRGDGEVGVRFVE